MITHDELFKLMNTENLLKMERWSGGHDEQMKKLIKGARVISHYNEGGYQGVVATIVQIPSGEFVAYTDYYGSCSGCDAWEDATDESVLKMCQDLIYTSIISDSLLGVIIEIIKKGRNSFMSWTAECIKGLEENCDYDEVGKVLIEKVFNEAERIANE